MAARKAGPVFSITPALRSWRPRWAMGRMNFVRSNMVPRLSYRDGGRRTAPVDVLRRSGSTQLLLRHWPANGLRLAPLSRQLRLSVHQLVRQHQSGHQQEATVTSSGKLTGERVD